MSSTNNTNSPLILRTVAFLAGFILMVLELSASRLIAPFVGNSVYIWTALIGVVLLSLSIGYWIGGRLSLRNNSRGFLVFFLFFSSLSAACIIPLKEPLFRLISLLNLTTQIEALIITLVLFAPTSICLGIISPLLITLSTTHRQKFGPNIGDYYALGSFGSILGTYLTGFIFLSYFHTTIIFYTVAALLFLLAVLVSLLYRIEKKYLFILILSFICLLTLLLKNTKDSSSNNILFQKNSSYSTITVLQTTDRRGNTVRHLLTSNLLIQTSSYLNSNILVNEYQRYFDLLSFYNSNTTNVLMLGGGGYAYPRYALDRYPFMKFDVVEIDPAITQVAKRYFNLKSNPRIRIFHEDGRAYLRKNNKQYDAVLVDVFNTAGTLPFHLTTKEFAKSVSHSLTKQGVVIVNIVSSISGERSKLLDAELRTYRSVFPHVDTYLVKPHLPTYAMQNIMLVGYKQRLEKETYTENIRKILKNKVILSDNKSAVVLTDDYAPIEFLTRNFVR